MGMTRVIGNWGMIWFGCYIPMGGDEVVVCWGRRALVGSNVLKFD